MVCIFYFGEIGHKHRGIFKIFVHLKKQQNEQEGTLINGAKQQL